VEVHQKTGAPETELLIYTVTALDETGAPIGVQQKLMRHSNVATTMNIYGSSSLRAKQKANSKVVEMVMTKKPPTVQESAA
jgi:integrase